MASPMALVLRPISDLSSYMVIYLSPAQIETIHLCVSLHLKELENTRKPAP